MFEEISENYFAKLKHNLKKCILRHSMEIKFDDIAGNDYAKEIIK
jgi:hypothetical protein